MNDLLSFRFCTRERFSYKYGIFVWKSKSTLYNIEYTGIEKEYSYKFHVKKDVLYVNQ